MCACVRVAYRLHTTPAMVYLLSIISDFPRDDVFLYMGVDVCMLVSGMFAQVTDSRAASVVAYACVFACFGYLLHGMWSMFKA